MFAIIDYDVLDTALPDSFTDLFLQVSSTNIAPLVGVPSDLSIVFGGNGDLGLNPQTEQDMRSMTFDTRIIVIPEPSTCFLLMLGAVPIRLMLRRRQA